MQMTRIESSNLKAAGFENGRLVVEFVSGTQYEGEATQQEYNDFLKAESKGSYFARVFRSRMTKVEDDDAA